MRTQAVLSLLCNDCDSWPGIDDGHLPPLGLAYQYQWLPLPIERASASSSPLVWQEQVAGCRLPTVVGRSTPYGSGEWYWCLTNVVGHYVINLWCGGDGEGDGEDGVVFGGTRCVR